VELELHQLELRYEGLKCRSAARERRLVASLAELGQQVPIVVVEGGGNDRFVVIDGHKRIRGLRRLGQDTVRALAWQLSESEALVVDRLMGTGPSDSAIEQGWLLRELYGRFELSLEELAQRFDRSRSWVSRRLGLVRELPEEIQQRVRQGELVADAAMKYLLPVSRGNREDGRSDRWQGFEHAPGRRVVPGLPLALGQDTRAGAQRPTAVPAHARRVSTSPGCHASGAGRSAAAGSRHARIDRAPRPTPAVRGPGPGACSFGVGRGRALFRSGSPRPRARGTTAE
jgi:ParB/RepB/Spo0J family partition protein